jgi:hypothetical protein
VNALPGAGEPAGIDHRNKALQQLQVEHVRVVELYEWTA